MPKINLSNGRPVPTMTSNELDKLLKSDDASPLVNASPLATKISDTKDSEFSATKDAPDISATKVSATKVSATKISDTKYINNYKREHYDTLRIDLPKGSKELLKQEAIKRNISVTKLIKEAILMYLSK